MANEGKTYAVDGQLVPFIGIHPFYLDMTFMEFLSALMSWSVKAVVVDEFDDLEVILSSADIEIKLYFEYPDCDPSLGPLDFRHLGRIHCWNASIENGSELIKLSNISASELQKITGIKMREREDLELIEPRLEICDRTYTKLGDDENMDYDFMINENNGIIESISLNKLVEGTYVE